MTSSEQPAAVSRDAADAPISEVAERFFKAIVAQVPIDRIEELHLFAPLRSGGVETGIAVIAARVAVSAAAETAIGEASKRRSVEASNGDVVESSTPEGVEALDGGSDDVYVEEPAIDESSPSIDASTLRRFDDSTSQTDDSTLRRFDDSTTPRFADSPIPDDPSPYAPDALHEIVEDAMEASIEYVAEEPLPVERHTVYTARYRLVQKGPERGKWEANVVDEADAPLITVEMVVRGVQRRAGEASDTTRFTGAQIARALRLPLQSLPVQP